MSTLKVTNVKHETSGLNTLVFDNGGTSGGNGRVTTKGTIGEVITVSYASTITLVTVLFQPMRSYDNNN